MGRTVWMVWLLIASVMSVTLADSTGEERSFFDPDAVVINVTEADLNRILRDALFPDGNVVEGSTSGDDNDISDLHYRADFAEPVLELTDAGAQVQFAIREASVRVGIEKKILSRQVRCEQAGVDVRPERPVDLTVDLSFEVADGDLNIMAEDLQIADPHGFRLVKPERCRNSIVPTWLLWWIGKSRLRGQVDELDELLLERLQEDATELNSGQDLLLKHWNLGPDETTDDRDVYLYAHALDTSRGSLLVRLAGSDVAPRPGSAGSPDWISGLETQSFLGLSESFLNKVLRMSLQDVGLEPYRPKGDLGKVFRDAAIFSLIPGLRDIERGTDLYMTFTLDDVPSIEFAALQTDPDERALLVDPFERNRAMVRVRLGGFAVHLWAAQEESDRRLGTLEIESASVAVAPYLSVLGGISFEIVENEWKLTSSGIDFNEELLAATLQEMVFGEVFQTRYEPVGRDGLQVADTEFGPRYFSRIGGHLVVALSPI